MNYTLHQLQVFLKITQTKSITKAAEELHLTQPAVSIQLKNLQEQFEIPLTEIIGRKLHVTDFGKELAVAAEKILNEVHAINFKTLAHKGLLSGRLKLSVVSTGKYVMPYFLSGFLKQHAGVELVMDVTNKSKVLECLENNETDFALVSILPEHLKVSNVELMQNKLYLVGRELEGDGSRHHGIELFEKLPLIYREPGSGTRLTMERFISSNKISVGKKIELTSNEAVKQALLAGIGYSIMPLIGIKNELNQKDLKIIPVDGLPLITSWNLIWLHNKSFSPVAEAYLNYIQQEKSSIIQKHFDWVDKYKD
ncbi:LysR family transcriptional regulator [Pontibacter cellulosilyticus]|uniref:LysR family transcriptional regulator n=1 Tax=Pontibacter cellulosilyticus TaxID=1720253 RepID=A0A923N8E7_9BACT|nr:LysR family transcriptional regulator [Pontibacter cellulosilyticus]MBC5993687.1 LysR family transcriptional regulator [Pontibacter cellulosilyticus]